MSRVIQFHGPLVVQVQDITSRQRVWTKGEAAHLNSKYLLSRICSFNTLAVWWNGNKVTQVPFQLTMLLHSKKMSEWQEWDLPKECSANYSSKCHYLSAFAYSQKIEKCFPCSPVQGSPRNQAIGCQLNYTVEWAEQYNLFFIYSSIISNHKFNWKF